MADPKTKKDESGLPGCLVTGFIAFMILGFFFGIPMVATIIDHFQSKKAREGQPASAPPHLVFPVPVPSSGGLLANVPAAAEAPKETIPPGVPPAPIMTLRIIPGIATRRAVVVPDRLLMPHESSIDDAAWIQFRAYDGSRDITTACRWESSSPQVKYLGMEFKLDFGAGYGVRWEPGTFAGFEPGVATIIISYQGQKATAKLVVEP